MTVTPDGTLFILEAGHRIRRIQDGLLTTVVGTGVAGFSGDGGPASLAQINDAWDVEVSNQHGELVASYDILTLVAKRG